MARRISVELVGNAASLERSFKRSEVAASSFDRRMSHAVRGAAAGSGAFRGLGRSLAFASGGFLAAASITDVLHDSIGEAQEATAVQRQLSAQFRASGDDLGKYQKQIDETSHRLSVMSGFQDEELTKSFTQAFRGTQKVSTAFKIEAAAADVARGRNIDLQTATIALTKAAGGQVTALRRLGIQVPKNASGLAALNYVQARFSGQAKAGTTSQQRFAVALKETEESIGRALLPTFNRLLGKTGEWLNKTQNQKKIQDGANRTLSVTGKIIHGLGFTVAAFTKGLGPMIGKLVSWGEGLHGFFMGLDKDIKGVVNSVTGVVGIHVGKSDGVTASSKQGQSTADRRMGRSPGGAGAFNAGATVAGAGRAGGKSLAYQISIANLALAKAQITAQKADDRVALVRLGVLTREKLAKTKDLAKRIELTQSIGSIEDQIRAIDDIARKKQQDAREKEREAREKERDKERKARQKELERAKRQAEKMRAIQEKVRAATEKLRSDFGSAVDSARSQIGELFQGPVLNATDQQKKQLLGVPATSAKTLTADLQAQVAQAKRMQHDLSKLRKRGASKELIQELRAQGTGAMPEIAALLNDPKSAKGFFKAFGQREKLAFRIARADMTVSRVVIAPKSQQPIVVSLEVDGRVLAKVATKHQDRDKAKTASQTRGRHGGR